MVATAVPTAPAAKSAARDRRPTIVPVGPRLGLAPQKADRVASLDVTGAPGTRPKLGTHGVIDSLR